MSAWLWFALGLAWAGGFLIGWVFAEWLTERL